MMNLGRGNKRRKQQGQNDSNSNKKDDDDDDDTTRLGKKKTESAILINSRKFLPDGFQPGPWDVICQRGGENFNHVGNQRFRLVVAQYLSGYKQTTTKQEKSEIVSSIVDTIRAQTGSIGGFIKKDLLAGRWYEVGDKLARDKVGQALRDGVNRSEEALLVPAALRNLMGSSSSSSSSAGGLLGSQHERHDHEEQATASSICSKWQHHQQDSMLSSSTRRGRAHEQQEEVQRGVKRQRLHSQLMMGPPLNGMFPQAPTCKELPSDDSNIIMKTGSGLSAQKQLPLIVGSNDQQTTGGKQQGGDHNNKRSSNNRGLLPPNALSATSNATVNSTTATAASTQKVPPGPFPFWPTGAPPQESTFPLSSSTARSISGSSSIVVGQSATTAFSSFSSRPRQQNDYSFSSTTSSNNNPGLLFPSGQQKMGLLDQQKIQGVQSFTGDAAGLISSDILARTKGDASHRTKKMNCRSEDQTGITALALQQDHPPPAILGGKIHAGEKQQQKLVTMKELSSTRMPSSIRNPGSTRVTTTTTDTPHLPAHPFHQWTELDLTPNPVVYPTRSTTDPAETSNAEKQGNSIGD